MTLKIATYNTGVLSSDYYGLIGHVMGGDGQAQHGENLVTQEKITKIETAVADKLAHLDIICLQEINKENPEGWDTTTERPLIAALRAQGFSIHFFTREANLYEPEDIGFYDCAIALKNRSFTSITNISQSSNSYQQQAEEEKNFYATQNASPPTPQLPRTYGGEIAAVTAIHKDSGKKIGIASLHSWGFALQNPEIKNQSPQFHFSDYTSAVRAQEYLTEALELFPKPLEAKNGVDQPLRGNLGLRGAVILFPLGSSALALTAGVASIILIFGLHLAIPLAIPAAAFCLAALFLIASIVTGCATHKKNRDPSPSEIVNPTPTVDSCLSPRALNTNPDNSVDFSILAGDLNTNPTNSPHLFQLMENNGYNTVGSHKPTNINRYEPEYKMRELDFIFLSKGFPKPSETKVVDGFYFDEQPVKNIEDSCVTQHCSDHLPVETTINLL